MLTGDNQRTAKAIAREVVIDRVLAEVLPKHKSEEVKKLQDEGKAVATSEYKGKRYYFYATGCKKAFDQNPEKYLTEDKKWLIIRGSRLYTRRIIYLC